MQVEGQIILKPGREQAVARRHPWIFSGAVQTTRGDVRDGCWVEVTNAKHETLGFGHYQKGTITVRMLSFTPFTPDEHLYRSKIEQAWQARTAARIMNHSTNCYRLIHGEGDGLPGLIVDCYAGVAVVQAHTYGMHADRQLIAQSIRDVMGNEVSAVYYKSHQTLAGHVDNEYLTGMAAVPHVVEEHGKKFYVDWEEGQKTGFFLDQRENRALLGAVAEGKTVLNTFCYTGGFSVYALAGGAATVHSVDASEKAVALARQNIALNGFDVAQHSCFASDTFQFLKDKANIYDVIVLDPPAFAKHKEARHQAMKGYQRLNAEAIKLVKSNGMIFTFSCSQVVDRQLFYDTIVSAAVQVGRSVQVLQHLGQPADHPVSIYHPEGEYLKGLILHVSD